MEPGQLLSGLPGNVAPNSSNSDTVTYIIMNHCFCKYCGQKTLSISALTSGSCPRHPDGPSKGRHALYEGSEKTRYQCALCGQTAGSISGLTSATCHRHPKGPGKGRHQPAL